MSCYFITISIPINIHLRNDFVLLITQRVHSENFPPTTNSYPESHKVVTRAAAKIVGEARSALPQKTMVAEDFSYFLNDRPGMRVVILFDVLIFGGGCDC